MSREQGTGTRGQGRRGQGRGSGLRGGDADLVLLAIEVHDDFNSRFDLAAFGGLADAGDEASGELAVGIEKAQAVRHAAEIARCETEPAAGFPFFGVEAGEGDFIQLGQLFGKS